MASDTEPISLFKKFQDACSAERLAPYKSGRSEIDALTLYAWNIALSEALYPLLQNLEIGLRNKIDTAVRVSHSDAQWFNDPAIMVGFDERQSVEYAEKRIVRRAEPVTPPAIVAELNFGFWSGLLRAEYDPTIWSRPNVIVQSFPYAQGHHRTRRNLFERFDQIRQLRNRVFHHDQVWHLDLKREHEKIIESLGWLNSSLQTATKVLDRFPEVISDDYLMQLKEQLMKACPVETKAFLAARRAGEPLTLPQK
jgi:hypothetical protein